MGCTGWGHKVQSRKVRGRREEEWDACSSGKDGEDLSYLQARGYEFVMDKSDTTWEGCGETGALDGISDFFGTKDKGEHSVSIGDNGIEMNK